MAAELPITPGHVIFIVRLSGDLSTTREGVEDAVVDWLGDAIGADPSRRSPIGEYVIGAANPVTVIPLLGMTDRELAAREVALCQGNATPFLGFLPRGGNAAALVHLDWGGVPSSLPTRWRHRFAGWEPTEDEAPDLAVTATCAQAERARPPIEPPTLADELPDLPEPPEIPELFRSPLTWFGVGVVTVVGFALWKSRKG